MFRLTVFSGKQMWGLYALTSLLLVSILYSFGHAPQSGAPFSDTVVLELQPGSETARRKLLTLLTKKQLEPQDTTLMPEILKHYFYLAESTSDPRFIDYASALLQKYSETYQLTADLKIAQSRIYAFEHEFESAIELLNDSLKAEPDNANALMARANYQLLQGNLQLAANDCRSMILAGYATLGLFCQSRVIALSGEPLRAYEIQTSLLPLLTEVSGLSGWAESVVAETALLISEPTLAKKHFKAALKSQPGHVYLLRRLTDIAIAEQAFAEVLTLTSNATPVDAILLRRARAAALAGNFELHQQAVRHYERNRQALLENNRPLHAADEAYYWTHIQANPEKALAAALQNWQTQKSPEDWILLTEAARLSGSSALPVRQPPWPDQIVAANSLVKNVLRAVSALPNQTKTRRSRVVNESIEPDCNAAKAMQTVFQQAANPKQSFSCHNRGYSL